MRRLACILLLLAGLTTGCADRCPLEGVFYLTLVWEDGDCGFEGIETVVFIAYDDGVRPGAYTVAGLPGLVPSEQTNDCSNTVVYNEFRGQAVYRTTLNMVEDEDRARLHGDGFRESRGLGCTQSFTIAGRRDL